MSQPQSLLVIPWKDATDFTGLGSVWNQWLILSYNITFPASKLKINLDSNSNNSIIFSKQIPYGMEMPILVLGIFQRFRVSLFWKLIQLC